MTALAGMRILIQVLLICLIFVGCKTDNNSLPKESDSDTLKVELVDKALQQEIFKDVINDFYEGISFEFTNLYDSNEVIVNPFNDHLDSIMIALVKKDSTLKLSQRELELFDRLDKILNEPLQVDFKSITKGQKFILNNKSQIDYNKPNYVGSTFISNVAVDEKMENGLFYIDLQLGDTRGSGGFFVFVSKKEIGWRIIDARSAWH